MLGISLTYCQGRDGICALLALLLVLLATDTDANRGRDVVRAEIHLTETAQVLDLLKPTAVSVGEEVVER